MIARCKKCNHAEFFDKNDVFGVRLKLKDQRCECGGRFEKMRLSHDPNRYINHRGDSYEYTEIGEFKEWKNTTEAK